MHTNEENKLSKEGLMKLIEGHLGFFRQRRFAEVESISWRLSELAKLPGGECGKVLEAVFFRLSEASGRYHEGRPATKGRLEGVEEALGEAISRAEDEAEGAQNEAQPRPSAPAPWEPPLPKTPTWPYGLPLPEEASPAEHKAPRGSHGR